MIPSGSNELLNYLTLTEPAALLYSALSGRGDKIEGISARTAVRSPVWYIPVICRRIVTASVIRQVIEKRRVRAVSIARPLVANNDLLRCLQGPDQAPKPSYLLQ
jgi:2,4-dienoyl-CoA reductase-like NADH-dependent reductase (Old Yellow Enzyme family)